MLLIGMNKMNVHDMIFQPFMLNNTTIYTICTTNTTTVFFATITCIKLFFYVLALHKIKQTVRIPQN